MLRTLTCTSETGRSTDMVDEVKKCEARLVALRARRQKWASRYAAVESVQGKATERAHCKMKPAAGCACEH
jgi:vacuolar-type H+-ATPase subunit I/STV1